MKRAPDPPGTVLEVPGVGYVVASRSTAGAYWLVAGDTCTCPATVEHCWHQRRVALFCRMQDEKFKRPAGRIVPSLMVD